MSSYQQPNETVVYLINVSLGRAVIRKRAAVLLLACLRTGKTPSEIGACLDQAERKTPGISAQARILASEAGIDVRSFVRLPASS
jgi:hypothetical protein